MKVIREVNQLEREIQLLKSKYKIGSIGFVPTMGALHAGHLSLIENAKFNSDIVVASIFVNPTQFNDKNDLTNYPRTESNDIEKLEKSGCDIVFIPSVDAIYPNKDHLSYEIDLNNLDTVMEGKFRDNHFNGVCMVVERLFNLVKPDKAFFGIKDFQQLAIIKHLVKVRNLDIEIIPCEIKREKSGLAMSSRNELLFPEDRKKALILFKTLNLGKKLIESEYNIQEIKKKMIAKFNKGQLDLEYIEIIDNDTLQPVSSFKKNITCCIAAYCGKIRLIDNIQLD